MKDKFLTFLDKIKRKYRSWSKRRRIVYGVGVLILIIILISLGGKKDAGQDTLVIAPQVLAKTVQVTGKLTSDTDLSLGFERAGVIKSTPVKVGTKVTQGTILATLSAGQESAEVTKARGNLLKAEAEYNQALEVTQGEGIENKELELANAIREQDLLVDNAYHALLSNDLEAVPTDNNDGEAPTVSGSYTCDIEGAYTIELYSSGAPSGSSYRVSGLEEGTGTVYTSSSDKVGECGLYISFPVGFSKSTDWEIAVPNTRSSTYITYKNAYELALDTREQTISELEAEVSLAKANVATGDTKIAYANLVSAQGEYQRAVAVYEETIIRAPSSGVVTKVALSPGDSVDMREEVVVLQDIDNLYVEADVNESNIVGIKPGQKVAITFDALTEDHVFSGTVSDIDLAPSDSGDVTNYTITALIDVKDPILRPGMTANMTVTLFQEEAIIAVPRRALIAGDDGWYVALKNDDGEESRVRVSLGRDADGGLVEITSGLSGGETLLLDHTSE